MDCKISTAYCEIGSMNCEQEYFSCKIGPVLGEGSSFPCKQGAVACKQEYFSCKTGSVCCEGSSSRCEHVPAGFPSRIHGVASHHSGGALAKRNQAFLFPCGVVCVGLFP